MPSSTGVRLVTGRTFRLETLEPRVLFSADLPVLVPVEHGPIVQEVLVQQTGETNVSVRGSEQAAQPVQLIIIDFRVPDIPSIHADLLSQGIAAADIHVLDAESDGIRQVSKILEAYDRVDSLHLVSHGAAGQLSVGNSKLDLIKILQDAESIVGWSGSFSKGADLLIYGCELAATDDGRNLIETLGQLTGLDVAASVDLTGATALGGNWELEHTRGDVETQTAFSEGFKASYDGSLATFTVSNLDDSGAGSLRQAIIDANNAGGADKIIFTQAGVISLTSGGLPSITSKIDIDGRTAPGYEDAPTVIINGATVATSGDVSGLLLLGGSDGSVIRGLAIHRFSSDGITLNDTSGILLAGNYIGTDGANDLGNTRQGIYLANSHDNVIGGVGGSDRNVIAGNSATGVWINAGSRGNSVLGNHIGMAASGASGLGNDSDGVRITGASYNNSIGGSSANERNIISGNGANGILVIGPGSNDNKISGNYIGTDSIGESAVRNGNSGVAMIESVNNTIGGSSQGEGNLISGNLHGGIYIAGSGSTGNHVLGNKVGTDKDGEARVPNQRDGISIVGNAHGNVIGGAEEFQDNLISGNNKSGLILVDANTRDNKILGNKIGTDADGSEKLQNIESGIALYSGASSNFIGGSLAGEGNLISGNGAHGIDLNFGNNNSNKILGNLIGTNASGDAKLPNVNNGVILNSGASYNEIGGATVGEGNTIAGNGKTGVVIIGPNSVGNEILGNYIGTNASGASDLGNGDHGIGIYNDVADTRIGQGTLDPGGQPVGANIIANNGRSGIEIDAGSGTGLSGTVVQGNWIGTDRSGSTDLGNTLGGVKVLAGAANTQIGGDRLVGQGNTISGNGAGYGLRIEGASTSNTTVKGNLIGVDTNAATILGNLVGIEIFGTTGTTIGSLADNEENVISGNASAGILGSGADIDDLFILGNLIGTNASGAVGLGNGVNGIRLESGAQRVTIGGVAAGSRNTIAANGVAGNPEAAGIRLISSDQVDIQGNTIGSSDATALLGNAGHGIYITDATGTAIGGTGLAAGNLIKDNQLDGIRVSGALASENSILGNLVHANAGLGVDLAGDGATDNDGGDADAGPNGLQNHAVIDSVTTNESTSVLVQGQLSSAANAPFRIEFFSTETSDASGHGQAERYLGHINVLTDGSGVGTFSNDLGMSLAHNQWVSSVVTRDLGSGLFGDSSEFSQNVEARRPNVAPEFAAHSEFYESPENNAIIGPLSASDDDGDTLTYTIIGGTDSDKFALSGNEVSFVAAPDHEAPADANGDNIYEAVVEVSDGYGGTDVRSLKVRVTDVNESGVGVVSDSDATSNTIDENEAGSTVGITALATDPDGTNNTVTYQLTDNASGRFAIDTSTGVVSVATNGSPGLDYESATSHDIIVEATSADGSKSNATFAIAVNDVDEFDVGPVNDIDTSENEIDENATSGTVGISALATDSDGTNNTVTYQLTDSAGGRFAIDTNTGVVSVATTGSPGFDYESATSHDIVVEATSADGSKSNATFAIAVKDVDEFDVGPVNDIDTSANEIDENATGGTVGITVLATDADGTNNTVSYQLTDNASGRFVIDTNTGVVSVATTGSPGFDYESTTSHDIIIEATSADGSKSNATFAISVRDIDEFDVGPVSDIDTNANEIDENATSGTVGIAAFATDGDGTNNSVTYQLTDSAGGRFAIDTSTGVVSVATTGSPGLDYENATSHDIIIEATSTDGSKSNATFTIAVNDVDEVDVGPITDADNSANEIDENATSGTVGITALATDADGTNNTVSYQLTDSAGGRFAIDTSTGVVSVATTGSPGFDYESATSHDIIVEATSADGSKSNVTFTIAVGDVDEVDVGPITDTDNSTNEVDEGATSGPAGITALATDADGTNNTVSYQLTDSAGGRFVIDTNTGVVSVATTGSPGFDYESATSHDIIVEATSADGSKSNATFAIAVNDVDEFDVGPVNDTDTSANEIDENATSGTVGITAFANDADGTNNSVTYQLTDSASGRFAIDTSTGVVSVATTGSPGFDYESATSHDIIVEATSADGSKSNATFAIAVNDVDEVDVGPVSDIDTSANEIDENATSGTVGITAFATDADGTNNSVTYQLTDSAGGRFVVDTNTGVVSVATPVHPGLTTRVQPATTSSSRPPLPMGRSRTRRSPLLSTMSMSSTSVQARTPTTASMRLMRTLPAAPSVSLRLPPMLMARTTRFPTS